MPDTCIFKPWASIVNIRFVLVNPEPESAATMSGGPTYDSIHIVSNVSKESSTNSPGRNFANPEFSDFVHCVQHAPRGGFHIVYADNRVNNVVLSRKRDTEERGRGRFSLAGLAILCTSRKFWWS